MNIAMPYCFSKIQKGSEGEERHLHSQYQEGHLHSQYRDHVHFQCCFPAQGASSSSSCPPFLIRAVWTSLTLPSPPASWELAPKLCVWPQGRGQRKWNECSLLLRQGRSLWKCFGSPENALFHWLTSRDWTPSSGTQMQMSVVGYKNIFLAGLRFGKTSGKCCIAQNSSCLSHGWWVATSRLSVSVLGKKERLNMKYSHYKRNFNFARARKRH